MTVSVSRLLSTLTAGGVLAGSMFFATGVAEAAPPPGGGTVPATCGQTVTAYPGDRIKVTPKLGVPFVQTATPGMGPVQMTISGLLCSVQVRVLKPISAQMVQVAPPLGSVTTRLTEETDKVVGSQSSQQQAAPSLVPAPRAAAPQAPVPAAVPGRAPVSTLPSQAPLSTLPAGDLSAAAPQFAPTFDEGLPSSFLSSGSPAPGARLDAGSLFGSAFPGMRAGAPAYLGYDPTSAVTTASQVQALPVDGLSEGVGLPAILAVLGLSGAAAFAVRRMVLGKSLVPAGLAGSTGAAVAPLVAAPSVPASTEAPAPVGPAEETALVAAVPSPAEETAVVAEAPLADVADAEVTAMTPAVGDLDPAEVTSVAPVLPAEATGVIDPVREHDGETTGVLSATASR